MSFEALPLLSWCTLIAWRCPKMQNSVAVFFQLKINRKQRFKISIFNFFFPDKQMKSLLNFLYSTFQISRSVTTVQCKVDFSLKGSLDLISSPSLSLKIQIFWGKVCFKCKGKTLLGIVNKLLETKSLLTSSSNVSPYYLK